MTWPRGAVMFHVQFASSEYFPMMFVVSMMPGLVTCPPQPAKTALSFHTGHWTGTITNHRSKQTIESFMQFQQEKIKMDVKTHYILKR
jgi:hypothetical protein